MFYIYKQQQTPALKSIIHDGREISLGIFHPLEAHPQYELISNMKINISWVGLDKNSELEGHYHSALSTVIVYEGSGVICTRDESFEVKEGDIIRIPKNCWHGFTTKTGFRGISIQDKHESLFREHNNTFYDNKFNPTTFPQITPWNESSSLITIGLCLSSQSDQIQRGDIFYNSDNRKITFPALDLSSF